MISWQDVVYWYILCRINMKSPVLDLLMKERYHRIIVDHMYCILIQRKKIQHLSNKNQDNTISYKIWNFTHSLDWKRLWLSFWKLYRLFLSQQFLINLAMDWVQIEFKPSCSKFEKLIKVVARKILEGVVDRGHDELMKDNCYKKILYRMGRGVSCMILM